jgi:uncharacterized protein (DUF1800 family)
MTASDPYLAFSRFGLGARPGDLAAFSGDPKVALAAEIADPTTLFLADAGLPSTADAFTQVREFQKARQLQRMQAAAAAKLPAAGADMMAVGAPSPKASMTGVPRPLPQHKSVRTSTGRCKVSVLGSIQTGG